MHVLKQPEEGVMGAFGGIVFGFKPPNEFMGTSVVVVYSSYKF